MQQWEPEFGVFRTGSAIHIRIGLSFKLMLYIFVEVGFEPRHIRGPELNTLTEQGTLSLVLRSPGHPDTTTEKYNALKATLVKMCIQRRYLKIVSFAEKGFEPHAHIRDQNLNTLRQSKGTLESGALDRSAIQTL
ncbi:hypothetical protein AVEN_248704-1 [Araneus ventricosus]|uniref:Uncharacterized protein n=1 Tax=Araneus ventricosus TaxID=182803 RepID=A0A4Y2MGE0_ARAVE|nr:hypothetical protein AVEN_248704-1 [Araneus ventricosus]